MSSSFYVFAIFLISVLHIIPHAHSQREFEFDYLNPNPPKFEKPFNSCIEAYKNCDWTFNDTTSISTFDINVKADTAFSPIVVSKNKSEKLLVLNSRNAFTFFMFPDGTEATSRLFGNPRFTINGFKALSNSYGSKLAHQQFHGNQLYSAQGMCVRIDFSQYQQKIGRKVQNLSASPPHTKCLVFMTKWRNTAWYFLYSFRTGPWEMVKSLWFKSTFSAHTYTTYSNKDGYTTLVNSYELQPVCIAFET